MKINLFTSVTFNVTLKRLYSCTHKVTKVGSRVVLYNSKGRNVPQGPSAESLFLQKRLSSQEAEEKLTQLEFHQGGIRERVERLFSRSEVSALKAHLLGQPEQTLSSKIDKFCASGLTENIILKNPYILLNSLKEAEEKIAFLEDKVVLNERSVILLALPSTKNINRALSKGWTKNVDYLKEELEIEYHALFSHLWSRHLYLLTMQNQKILDIMMILKNANVDREAILNDLYIFKPTPEVVKKRMDVVKAQGISLRTWMLHCENPAFKNHLEKLETSINVFGADADVADYLVKRLQCDRETVKDILLKYKIHGRFPQKLKKLLDYLFEEGFCSEDIIQSPRILHISLEKIQQRHAAFKSFGIRPKQLITYTYGDRQFQGALATQLKKQKRQKKQE